MNQIESEAAEEQLANEARTGPLALARRLGDVTGFFLEARPATRCDMDYSLKGGHGAKLEVRRCRLPSTSVPTPELMQPPRRKSAFDRPQIRRSPG